MHFNEENTVYHILLNSLALSTLHLLKVGSSIVAENVLKEVRWGVQVERSLVARGGRDRAWNGAGDQYYKTLMLSLPTY